MGEAPIAPPDPVGVQQPPENGAFAGYVVFGERNLA
jgi:hypothetical protein